jgi:aminomethyltransferase
MPIEYAGALAEHRAVRERVGLFDLTHLGKVDVEGPGALGLLQGVVTNDVASIAVGEAQYNLVLNEGGGVIEDLIVYRLEADRYFVVPNAANTQRVLQILGRRGPGASI